MVFQMRCSSAHGNVLRRTFLNILNKANRKLSIFLLSSSCIAVRSICFALSILLLSLYNGVAAQQPSTSYIVHRGLVHLSHNSASSWASRRVPHGTAFFCPGGRKDTALGLNRPGSSAFPEPQGDPPSAPQRQRWSEFEVALDVPTTPKLETIGPAQIPPRPKIVVFGASGRIGRRIISMLMKTFIDMDVVAFVRDGRKFEQVLMEEDVAMSNLGGAKRKGPRLQVVLGDLLSRKDVCRGQFETQEETNDLNWWTQMATNYFHRKKHRTSGAFDKNQNNSTLPSKGMADIMFKYERNDDHDQYDDHEDIAKIEAANEALQESISGATVLISCVGTHRLSNWWTDYLRVPFIRIFRKDASKWCPDATHPYYVNYLTTKKILELAETEQRRRNAWTEFEIQRLILEQQWKRGRRKRLGLDTEGEDEEEDDDEQTKIAVELRKRRNSGFGRYNSNYYENGENNRHKMQLPKGGQPPTPTDRIKIIRISDLSVGENPLRLHNIITNVFRSVVFRYQDMGEKLLQQSQLVDTIVLRPGQLTDDKRNVNNTWLQLSVDGAVSLPSLVGRDDVAEVAVAAALTQTSVNPLSVINETNKGIGDNLISAIEGADIPRNQTHHFTWALRWTGQHLPKPQGLRPDGLPTAALCLVKAIRAEVAQIRLNRLEEKKLQLYYGGKEWARLKKWFKKRWQMKPYAISVAASVYMTVGLLGWALVGPPLIRLISKLKASSILHFLN